MPLKRKYILTPRKEKFIRENYDKLTDEEIGRHVKVPRTTVAKWRARLGLPKRGAAPKIHDRNIIKAPEKHVNLKRLSDEDRRAFFLQQLRRRPRYSLMKEGLSKEELLFYENKYVEYFSSPDIETLTVQEEDDLHEMTMLQIAILRLRKEEYDSRLIVTNTGVRVDNSKAIKEATELVMKFKQSLDLERRQRLKRQEDSATNFTNLIREINQEHTRRIVGEEATMLKFRMEEMVNTLINHGLMHGVESMPVEKNFINDKLPEDYMPPTMEMRTEDSYEREQATTDKENIEED